ncbi:MAG TPA: hypothetical protein VLT33_09805 [Labilithrix sp.]|nr:hypothetical protein [Labilithrix sp.]
MALVVLALEIEPARADAPLDSSYEIENVDAHPEQVFVAWPRSCGSTGEPLGAVSLQLNPDWVARLHEVDYEVLGKGRHQISSYCAKTMRIHALSASAFARASRAATADDASLGKKAGETMEILPALDAIDLPKRVAFFATDPRRASAAYAFDEAAPADAGAVKAVHRVLVAEGVGTPAFALKAKTISYTFEQGPPLTVSASASTEKPATADGERADAGVAATVTAAPAKDLGTRWVYAAALGGLIAGGLIAHYRKKKAAS